MSTKVERLRAELAIAERKLEEMKRQRNMPPLTEIAQKEHKHAARILSQVAVRAVGEPTEQTQGPPQLQKLSLASYPAVSMAESSYQCNPSSTPAFATIEQRKFDFPTTPPPSAGFLYGSERVFGNCSNFASSPSQMVASSPVQIVPSSQVQMVPSSPVQIVHSSPVQVLVSSPVQVAESSPGSLQQLQSQVMHLTTNIQQRALQIHQLQCELAKCMKRITPPVPTQYQWMVIPSEETHSLAKLIGLEEAVTRVVADTNPAVREDIVRQQHATFNSHRPKCYHCEAEHAAFWRAYPNQRGEQVITCENCDWRRVKAPLQRHFRDNFRKMMPRVDQLNMEIYYLLSIQRQEDQLLRESRMKLQSCSVKHQGSGVSSSSGH